MYQDLFALDFAPGTEHVFIITKALYFALFNVLDRNSHTHKKLFWKNNYNTEYPSHTLEACEVKKNPYKVTNP